MKGSAHRIRARRAATARLQDLIGYRADSDLAWAPICAAVTAGADPDIRSGDGGMTLLMRAARLNADRPDLIDTLLSHAAAINLRDKAHRTALMHAAAMGNTAVVNRLLAAGALVQDQDIDGWTALMYAARYGRTNALAALLAVPHLPVDQRDFSGWTALRHVVVMGTTESMSLLVGHGADLCASSACGRTFLAICEDRGRQDLVIALDETLSTAALAATRDRLWQSLDPACARRLLPRTAAIQRNPSVWNRSQSP